MSATLSTLVLPAPAKINLFLRILHQRADGYHALQTAFQFLDLADELTFQLRDDDVIQLSCDEVNCSSEENLIYRVAKMIQQSHASQRGVNIHCKKNIPHGAGLGGGSSDAATTLKALNQLWDLSLTDNDLMAMGANLGADVPIFLFGQAAWAEGVGEQLTPMPDLPCPAVCLLIPSTPVSTASIFKHPNLPRQQAPYILGKIPVNRQNDCQALVSELYPEIATALSWANQQHFAWLTGTGCAIVSSFETTAEAKAWSVQIPPQWRGIVAQTCAVSPLACF